MLAIFVGANFAGPTGSGPRYFGPGAHPATCKTPSKVNKEVIDQ